MQPRKPRQPRKATEPKQRATRPWSETNEEALAKAEALFAHGIVIDTETTGLQPSDNQIKEDALRKGSLGNLRERSLNEGDKVKRWGDSITEIAAVRIHDKKVLFHSLVKPEEEFNPKALELATKAGFPLHLLDSAPTWNLVFRDFCDAVHPGLYTGWNSDFDDRMIRAMNARWGAPPKIAGTHAGAYQMHLISFKPYELYTSIGLAPWCDSMEVYMRVKGLGRRISLENASLEENIGYSGTAHNATADCLMVADIIHQICNQNGLQPTVRNMYENTIAR